MNLIEESLPESENSLNPFTSDSDENNPEQVNEAVEDQPLDAKSLDTKLAGDDALSVEEPSTGKQSEGEQAPFIQELEEFCDPESKLQKAISMMESALSQHGHPRFRDFWNIRHLCLGLFKESLNPTLRADLWLKFSELSQEARRLKEILDEQSAFAAEQIEIAIAAIEVELAAAAENITSFSQLIPTAAAIENRVDWYSEQQGLLNNLNAQASRINALRKELVRTEMRVRLKNKLFQRLSVAGDKVFPRRKELIKLVSQQFVDDVKSFIDSNFNGADLQDSLFFLREEIKTLQGVAKVLTLNTHAFTETRLSLSECWDKIKSEEKERKKARAQQKMSFKQNADQVLGKIAEFKTSFEEGQLSIAQAQDQIEAIFSLLKTTELGRDEVRWLKDEFQAARQPVLDKMKAEELQKKEEEGERERVKKEKYFSLKEEIETLVKNVDQIDLDQLNNARELLLEKIAITPLSKFEKQEIDRLLKPLKDLISEKKEQALLALSDDDRQAIQGLKEVLTQRKKRRQEVKNQIEAYRKAQGSSSGFDFERAMQSNAQMNIEKERLEKLNAGIQEIEDKLAEIEKRT